MDPLEHRAALVTEGQRVADLPAEALGAPVGACPGWDVERLVTHLGRVHGWALLAAWHRTGLDTIDVVGDEHRAQAILDAVHVT